MQEQHAVAYAAAHKHEIEQSFAYQIKKSAKAPQSSEHVYRSCCVEEGEIDLLLSGLEELCSILTEQDPVTKS